VTIQPLFIPIGDWRELENTEVKVDASWQDAHEFVNEDGEVECTEIEARWWPDRSVNKARYWLGDEFAVRFGSWNHERVICEVEGMLDAEEIYYRDPPSDYQPAASVDSSKAFLFMGQTAITKCDVEVPSYAADPVQWARDKVARHLGFRAFRSTAVRPVGDDAGKNTLSWTVTLIPNFG
jgi:hypothetical protein